MAGRALVLFNLGGPDQLSSVRPFLFNLFNDRAILDLPLAARWCLAQIISRRRAPFARDIYRKIGGSSPLLTETRAQALAIEAELGAEWRVFVAMRYWHPFSAETALTVKGYNPDHIVLLPLYPQYSTTTTSSSLSDWGEAAAAAGLDQPTSIIGCYPKAAGFIKAHARLLRTVLTQTETERDTTRVLFSAHGLPKKVVANGDPYEWQVQETAAAVAQEMAASALDWRVCYQSQVGPLEWIGPSTEQEVRRAGAEGKSLIVVPIAFVSEHSETLVELDIDYRRLAAESGVPNYRRVPALGIAPDFIRELADLARVAGENNGYTCLEKRICPSMFNRGGCNFTADRLR